MNKSRNNKIVIRVLSLMIAIILLIGLFLSFFQTRAIDKQLQEIENQNNPTITNAE